MVLGESEGRPDLGRETESIWRSSGHIKYHLQGERSELSRKIKEARGREWLELRGCDFR